MTQQDYHRESITTPEYQFVLNKGGLIFWGLPWDTTSEDLVEPGSNIGYLTPNHALLLARRILAHQEMLEQQVEIFDQVYPPLADAIVEVLRQRVAERGKRFTGMAEARSEAYHAYIHLSNAETNAALNAWREASYVDRYSHEQQLEILLYYVRNIVQGNPEFIEDTFVDENPLEKGQEI